jgi:CPA1 family monovalent cation:H+ antiporter
VRLLGLPHEGRREAVHERESEIAARREILDAARHWLERIGSRQDVSDSLLKFLEARQETRSRAIPDPPANDGQPHPPTKGSTLVRELITEERRVLHDMLRDGKITDETRRRIERDLDLEEAVVNNREKNTPL